MSGIERWIATIIEEVQWREETAKWDDESAIDWNLDRLHFEESEDE